MNVAVLLLASFALLVQAGFGREFTNDFVVELDGDDDIADLVAATHGLRVVRQSLGMKDVYHFIHDSVDRRSRRSADDLLDRLNRDPNVKFVEQQHILERVKRQPVKSEKREIVYDKQIELELPEIDQVKLLERYFGSSKKRGQSNCEDNSDLKKGLMEYNDPYYCLQWYLTNTGKTTGKKGNDLNVMKAWERGYDGAGVVVTVLDDGLDHKHPDLRDNYYADASYDLNDLEDKEHDPTPSGGVQNAHGTRCAGEIAAKANNGICGVGVAHGAKIGGIRLLDGQVTDGLESEALSFKRDIIDIYSASWGPRDDGKTMDGPRHFGLKALKEGAEKGRGGKGSIYVWATGNGGQYDDDCDCDGYVSSPYTISIGSVNANGENSYFSEWCMATMAVVYTGGSHARPGEAGYEIEEISVITDDINGGCDLNFQGTSSAAPLAAGCIALTLQANPNLTWRDVQNIIAETAVIPNGEEDGWTINGGGYHVNPRFGLGALDCDAMVIMAEKWETVAEQHVCQVPATNPETKLESGKKIVQTLTTDGCSGNSHIDRLEHTQIYINMAFTYRGDLSIHLISPRNTSSEILSVRPRDDSDEGIDEWVFLTMHTFGENPAGVWTLIIEDKGLDHNRVNSGTLLEWNLILSGVEGPNNNMPERQGKISNRPEMTGDSEAHEANSKEIQQIYDDEKEEKQMEKKEQFEPVETFNKFNEVRNWADQQDYRVNSWDRDNSWTDVRKKDMVEDFNYDDAMQMIDELLREIQHEKKKL